jgi:NADH-quinone oxidoreductase subunit K
VAVPYTHALALAAILFTIGLAGVLARRNLLFVLMSIEIMLNAGGLALVAAGARWGQADGQVMLLFVLAAAAAEVAVGLALVVRLHRHDETLDADRLVGEQLACSPEGADKLRPYTDSTRGASEGARV